MKSKLIVLFSLAFLISVTGCSNSSGSVSTQTKANTTETFVPIIETTSIVIEDNITENKTNAELSLSDQILGTWHEYHCTADSKPNSYNSSFVYNFYPNGKVDITTSDGRVYSGSSWYVSGTDIVIKNIVWYALEYSVNIVNGELVMQNSQYGITLYCRR